MTKHTRRGRKRKKTNKKHHPYDCSASNACKCCVFKQICTESVGIYMEKCK